MWRRSIQHANLNSKLIITKKSPDKRSFISFSSANYFLTSVVVVVVLAAVVSAAGVAAVVSTAGAGVTSVVVSTAVVSAVASVASASFPLQETTVRAAIATKLKITFFILLNYKRLIINSRQRYKFFNTLKLFSQLF